MMMMIIVIKTRTTIAITMINAVKRKQESPTRPRISR